MYLRQPPPGHLIDQPDQPHLGLMLHPQLRPHPLHDLRIGQQLQRVTHQYAHMFDSTPSEEAKQELWTRIGRHI
jgi:hypothetical protein